ncbi:MAG: histidine triad nucleotide-binding protein [Candidatus Yanofskybacteria bacterium RIFCSPHIGHO2_02_FULL_44_12b]|uniref:Histidine triad nucleotide-binding protein n=2 Tax=Candidatus Yanofskyibacteriota TaxID=1752733 RepID=A0A1F8GIF2_9BACT|nr:MAG: Histidine triad (HIT) protein [Candidatus Yanofskybacteria bacterium GW2011_GWA2_44_9]OGN04855.1 MAG: histidine triad nucleotide-binding protein [Candidatus Yanofskybacteria bacterium RIFCSPHIGHO2_01_FULL_44_24]OGN14071.1 MAG: histidine triad nucleotide-binding protein [Candidatus Yanofskybacteria bacterium RIFCSPHIGHO2_02_FULL_44_12b]OGN25172.1 MAG: histidine triad nucleotide-binding protein [Candidatus Yanofskybacteria bacterium RIFCSPLOWO2_01_FULL_44_22]
MIDDIFCKIIKGELKAEAVYKDAEFWVIKDINPQAPVHLLIIPVKHFESIHEVTDKDASLLGRGLMVADKVAHDLDLGDKGYRLIINEGEDGGKLVPHFHIHLLGGKKLGPKIVK